MKILMPLYPCEGCCDQCYALDDLRVFFDTAYCEYCWGERSESNWPLWDDAGGAVALPEGARGPVLSEDEVRDVEGAIECVEAVASLKIKILYNSAEMNPATALAGRLRNLLSRQGNLERAKR